MIDDIDVVNFTDDCVPIDVVNFTDDCVPRDAPTIRRSARRLAEMDHKLESVPKKARKYLRENGFSLTKRTIKRRLALRKGALRRYEPIVFAM